MKGKEIRQLANNITSNEDRIVEGYAVVFESRSENLGFYEIIHKGAITEDTIKNSDVLCKFNHDDSKVLARSKYGKGSLELTVDDKGVKYRFKAPNTEAGNDLLEYLNRGDLNASSFAFTVSQEEGSERWYKKDDAIYREINKIDKLYDVSPVFQPAYEETSCSARLKEIKATSDEIDNKMELLKKEINKL